VNVTVFTIFPELVRAACEPSILGAAIEKGILAVDTVDPREFTTDRHRKVDDIPFGGGGGMVMMAEPLALALASIPLAGSTFTSAVKTSPLPRFNASSSSITPTRK